jgi:endonuclease I
VWDALDVLDKDPNDPTKVIDVYSGDSLILTNKCGSTCPNVDSWNREHTWAQSRGSFNTAAGPGTDLFHMHVSRANTNSSRGNKDYDNGGAATVPGCPVVCHADGDSFEPRNAIKGDIARGLMYMDVRYNGDADDGFGTDLKLWNSTGDSSTQIGKLSTLVAWSVADPPDDAERLRNNLIDGDYQHNRNPFIDHPEWVCSIWGSSVPAGTCTVATNQPPTTAPMTKTTAEDTATTVALAANDPDGDALTWSVTTPAAHGTASITGGSTLSYTPAADFHGDDVVGVTVSDGKGGSATTTVTITVTSVNDAPVATPQSVSTPEDTAKVVTLAGTDEDGDPLTYAIASQPAHGTVGLAGSQATYTPAANYNGPDSFTFTSNDGTVASSAATVSITVTPVNDDPTVSDVELSTTAGTPVSTTLTPADLDGDTLAIDSTSTPANGTVTHSGLTVTYTPTAKTATDTFSVTVSDGQGGTATAEVSVSTVARTATVSLTTPGATRGQPVTTTIVAAGPTGPAPSGPVTLTSGGIALGTSTFGPDGTATVTWTPAAAGAVTLVAAYAGDQLYDAAAASGAATVAKSPSVLKFAGKPKHGHRAKLTVTIGSVGGVAATGQVTLKVGKKTLTAQLVNGVAKFRVKHLPSSKKLKVTATYVGDGQYAAATAKHRYRIKG